MSRFRVITSPAPRLVHPTVRKIGRGDLRYALAKGMEDFLTMPSSLFFLALIYPAVGIWLITGSSPHLIFPLISGFALVGPFAAVGLYEISRRRERRLDPSWKDAFAVMHSHSILSILALGFVLLAIFICWQFTAHYLYLAILGAARPETFGGFLSEVLTTPRGWLFIGVTVATGLLYAALVLSISAVSFPLLLDRNVGVPVAVCTSVRAVLKNPATMALWGLTVAGILAAGFLLLLVGLAVAVPVLGHSSWHLYRRAVDWTTVD
jgi:uncharacterized membrane protein